MNSKDMTKKYVIMKERIIPEIILQESIYMYYIVIPASVHVHRFQRSNGKCL